MTPYKSVSLGATEVVWILLRDGMKGRIATDDATVAACLIKCLLECDLAHVGLSSDGGTVQWDTEPI